MYGSMEPSKSRAGMEDPLISSSARTTSRSQQLPPRGASARSLMVSPKKSKRSYGGGGGGSSGTTRPVLQELFTSPKQQQQQRQPSRAVRRSNGMIGHVPHEPFEDPHRQDVQPLPLPITPHRHLHKKKSFVYTMLNPRSSSLQAVTFKWFMTTVICLDLLVFVISTEPGMTTDDWSARFYAWEAVTSVIFLVEYLGRLVTVTESTKYGTMGPLQGRITYCTTSFSAIVDALATLPFFVELITGLNLPTLTWVRSFRLLRILKTSGMAQATHAVWRVIFYNRQILYVALMVCCILIVFTSVLMYYLRPQEAGEEEWAQFQSIASTMYLSTLMLTGQGGPEGEMPWYTKGVVLLTGVFSIGMFAIPASMLTWGFEAEAERMAKRHRQMLLRAKINEMDQNEDNPNDENGGGGDTSILNETVEDAVDNDDDEEEDSHADHWSYSSCDYSTDEEYQKIIAGEEEEETDDEDSVDPFKEAIGKFLDMDTDGSGTISLSEFLHLSLNREQQGKQKQNLEEQERSLLAGQPSQPPLGTPGMSSSSRPTNEDGDGYGLAVRLAALERKVEQNTEKLDQICRGMEQLLRNQQK